MATQDFIMRNKRHDEQRARRISIICLIGRFQAGKSVFINEFRQEREEGRFLEDNGRTTLIEESERVYREDILRGYCFVEMPGFQNQPPEDGDGEIIRAIAKFLVRVYEHRGFAGLVYLHDYPPYVVGTIVKRDIALVSAMIGQELYDHTALVLNKCGGESDVHNKEQIRKYWEELTANNETVIRENMPPRGNPRPIIESIWEKPPGAFALAKELRSGKKLCETTVGKVYRKLLKEEIKDKTIPPARRKQLENELKKWKKSKDTYSDLK